MYEEKFLRRAIRLASLNIDEGGGPFGAVIVRDGEVIAEAGNRVTLDHDPTAHAEVIAIRLAAKKSRDHSLKGCDIYASCRPCPMCLAAIYWARIDHLYYAAGSEDAARAGFDDALLYREISLSEEKRKVRIQRFLSEEGRLPFQKWLNTSDRKQY